MTVSYLIMLTICFVTQGTYVTKVTDVDTAMSTKLRHWQEYTLAIWIQKFLYLQTLTNFNNVNKAMCQNTASAVCH